MMAEFAGNSLTSRGVVLWGMMMLGAAPVAAAAQAEPACTLSIGGAVPTPRIVTASDLAALPRIRGWLPDHDRPPVEYEGVSLAEVLGLAGVTLNLRGPRLAQYLLATATAADGYRVVYALAELDSSLSVHPVVLQDRKNGTPLDAHEGPCRIVVPDARRPARSIRQVTSLEVRTAPSGS